MFAFYATPFLENFFTAAVFIQPLPRLFYFLPSLCSLRNAIYCFAQPLNLTRTQSPQRRDISFALLLNFTAEQSPLSLCNAAIYLLPCD